MRIAIVFLLAGLLNVQAQNTYDYVYFVLQQRCASCHSGGNPAGGLDLKGSGSTSAQQQADVYNRIVNGASGNAFNSSKGHKVVSPGDVWRSTLFRKSHAGLQPNLLLDPAEGDAHDDAALHRISSAEKEAIRQWILHGAPATGQVVDMSLIQQYYNGQGVPSFSTPPPAPDPSEGFQIQMGPFFLAPNDEHEYFLKYPTLLPQDVEVTRMEAMFGPYSHHFILFDYRPNQHTAKPNGLRDDNAHIYTSLSAVYQYPDTFSLPEGSALFWNRNTYLDLNSHYVNYSQDKVAACEAYLNIYTQPRGIARQQMHVALVANLNILIPNDGQLHRFSAINNDPGYNGKVYIWGITSHTHQYGRDFDIFTRTPRGDKDDQIFDAEYMHGDPSGFYTGYDYQHPPIRYFHDFLPIVARDGLTYEAAYRNTGPRTVRFGDTSDDEMMVMAYFYLLDTTGVNPSTRLNPLQPGSGLRAGYVSRPDGGSIRIEGAKDPWLSLSLFDMQGRECLRSGRIILPAGGAAELAFDTGALPSGVYLCRISGADGVQRFAAKWFMH